MEWVKVEENGESAPGMINNLLEEEEEKVVKGR